LYKVVNYNIVFIGTAKSAIRRKTESGFVVGRLLAVLDRKSICNNVMLVTRLPSTIILIPMYKFGYL